jgi:RND family efflux transporter MFP subunit
MKPLIPSLVLALLLVGLGALRVQAHAGEDHSEAPPPPSATADVRSASATTTALEVVVRWPARPAAAAALRFRILASEYATNAPVEGAQIELTLATPGKADVVVAVPATKSPGVYEADITLPADAHYALAATVIAGELVDVVAIPDVEIGPPPIAAVHDRGGVTIGVIVAGLALMLTALFFVRRRRRARVTALVAAALLFASVGHTHAGEDHGDQKPAAATAATGKSGRVFLAKESQFLLGVRTAIVETRALADRVIVPGVVTAPPERQAAVLVPQSGRVTPPRGGFPILAARIKRGQLLGVVEAVLSAPERASFLSEEADARADAAAAAARVATAEKALARLHTLTGVASQQQIEAAEAEVSSARAAVAGAQARQSAFSTQNGVSRFELVSPLDGVLADINASPGEILRQGDRAFLVLDPTELRVDAKVPEHELARLLGSGDALVSVDAFSARSFAGRLLAQGQVIDEATRTAKVIFAVNNDEGLLKLGMFARVQIGAGAERNVVAVPDAAVLDIDGRRVVYVHATPEEFEAKEIALGRRDGDMYEVVQGLEGGERVVVVGAFTLRNVPAS